MSGILQTFLGGSITGEVVGGQEEYTTPGTYSWTAPVGVTSVSVVCVGAGGASGGGAGGAGGTGGGLGYINNLSVGPGQAYTVVVGEGGGGNTGAAGGAGTDSYFINTSNVKGGGGSSTNGRTGGGTGGSYYGTGGGNGGDGASSPGSNAGGGGGGAGGYSGAGGDGSSGGDAADGSGGGGGGGATIVQGNNQAGGGGGVGIYGQGSNGAGGVANISTGQGGHGGSGGLDGGDGSHNNDVPTHGGQYGGGPGAMGGGGDAYDGSHGAVRIIWPGTSRQFPSANTASIGDNFGGSVYFDGNDVLKIYNNHYVYNDPDNEWKIATNEAFSFEAWVKFDFSHSNYGNVFSNWTNANSYDGILFHVMDSGKIFLGFKGGTYQSGSTYVVSDDTWTHVAVTRESGSGGVGKFFIDGMQDGTWTQQGSCDGGASMYIGANMDGGSPNYEPKGYISNARVVIGEQVYTSNFTPSTELLTTTSQGVTAENCVWLGCQSRTSLTAAVDGSGYGASASIAVSDPTASVETPFS